MDEYSSYQPQPQRSCSCFFPKFLIFILLLVIILVPIWYFFVKKDCKVTGWSDCVNGEKTAITAEEAKYGGAKCPTTQKCSTESCPACPACPACPKLNLSMIPRGDITVSSSSNFDVKNFPNSNLIDGIYETFACTNNGPNQWFSLDLGKDIPISQIIIINRKDCCQDRIVGSILTIVKSDGTEVFSSTLTSLKSEYILTPNVTGKIVKVLQPKDNYLNIAEMQIFTLK